MNIEVHVKLAIDWWKQSDKSDEWYFSNLRNELLSNCDSESAFNGINELMPVLLDTSDDFLYIEIIEIVVALARKSQTTEIPIKLKENFGMIARRLNSQGDYAISKLEELALYYRILI